MKRLRKPTSPGEILKNEFLIPLNLTQKKLAEHLNCDLKVINRLVNKKTSLSAEMAIKLGATFDMTPEFWMNAQLALDIFEANQNIDQLPTAL